MLKTRRIKIRTGAIDEATFTDLSQLDGVHECAHKAGRISIKYDLGLCDYQTIHRYLTEKNLIDTPSAFQKIKHTLILACEKNQRDYNENLCGWDYYAQSLYIGNATGKTPRDEK